MKKNILIVLSFLLLVTHSEAIEIDIRRDTLNSERVKKESIQKIKNLLEDFPDKAYTVELDEDVQFNQKESAFLISFKLKPNKDFVNALSEFIQQASDYELVGSGKPWLGVEVKDNRSTKGAVIVGLEIESPFVEAGVKIGDVIQSVNGKMIDGAEDFKLVEKELLIGEQIKLEAYRPEQNKFLSFQSKVNEEKLVMRKSDKELYKKHMIPSILLANKEHKVETGLIDELQLVLENLRVKEPWENSYQPNYVRFPITIRYILNDSSGRILETIDKDFKGVFYKSKERTEIDLDNLYGLEEEIGHFNEKNMIIDGIKDEIRTSFSPEKVKGIDAYVVTAQKIVKEKEQKMIEEKKRIQKKEIENKKNREQEARRLTKRKLLLPKCDNKIMSFLEFYSSNNPHADKGKCVEVAAIAVQMSSANRGLFKIANNFYLSNSENLFEDGL